MSNNSNLNTAAKIFRSGVIKNISSNVVSVIARTVFIYYLGKDLLGINSAVSSIINILSLSELGVGTSFIYILYDALNRDDKSEINDIMCLFKKIYSLIGLLIFTIGILLIPFLDNLITTPDAVRNYVLPCYIIFVIQTSISYMFSAYKRCLLMADKKENVVNNVLTIYSVSTSCIQMLIVATTRNYLLYLFFGLVAIVLQNIAISVITQKRYPFLSVKDARKVKNCIKDKLKESVFSIMVVKLGQAFYKASDNLVISKYLGVGVLALYDNYNLILYSLQQILSMMVTSFAAIIGHVALNESSEQLYEKYKKLEFVTVLLFAICATCYVNCIMPFINWWIGDEYLLSEWFAVIFALRFFVIGLNITLMVYKDAMGLFRYGRFLSPITGIMNVILSIMFVNKIGIEGVVLASLICDLFIYYVAHPRAVIKVGLGMPLKEYYKNYIMYWLLMIGSLGMSAYLCGLFTISMYLAQFLVNGLISVICVFFLFFVTKRKSVEWKYLESLVISKIKER